MRKPTQPPHNTQFTHGAPYDALCEMCSLPCGFDSCGEGCHRRHFLDGSLECSYFFRGYCFLVDQSGCAFDNGGKTEGYWLALLRDYIHNVTNRKETEDFLKAREQTLRYLEEQIDAKNVYLCRYVEEKYNQALETGGSASSDELEHLDKAYELLMSGSKRKP